MTTLIERIRHSVIGSRTPISTPFGEKPLIYADYTASGRSLGFIEDFIREQVLPFYANTHTETSFTGAQTTALREQARSIIRRAVNGGSDDQVIFCGAGATAAINKLIDIMNLRLPDDLSRRYDLASSIPPSERPVVFIGPYEHHSNELPWRESIAELVVTPLDGQGQIDSRALEARLLAYADRPLKIGSFSAASNVTGVKSDVAGISALLKKHGALAFWDYAAAAPYVGIDMNGDTPLDAVFISPHKFIGGPGTPGVLVAKKAIMQNRVPAVVGGGTVKYVTPVDHRYIEDHERREEGGTPGIVESIRAGLVFKLQQEVSTREISRLEGDFVERALERFSACPGLTVLGERNAPRLSIVSLRFRHGQRDLHYGFVVALLNDLFGIQMRGGCSCAGPYGHNLLGMDMAYSKAIETELDKGNMLFRPGWVRLNFNYFHRRGRIRVPGSRRRTRCHPRLAPAALLPRRHRRRRVALSGPAPGFAGEPGISGFLCRPAARRRAHRRHHRPGRSVRRCGAGVVARKPCGSPGYPGTERGGRALALVCAAPGSYR